MSPEEARARLESASPAERRVILSALAREADARVTPAVAALLHADDPELVAQTLLDGSAHSSARGRV